MSGVRQVDFDELDVPIGTSVQLEFISPPGRYMVSVLGAIPGRSLILSCPKVNGKNILVRESQLLNIRVMLDTEVCAFSSKVAKSYLEPGPHIHIAYPEYVEASMVRTAARVETRLICRLEPVDGSDSIPAFTTGVLVDLSLGGAKLVSKEDFGLVSQKLKVSLGVNVAGYHVELKLDGEIRSQEIQMLEQLQASLVDNELLEKMNAEYFYVYGVRFENISREAAITLKAFILETQKSRLN